MKLEKLFWLGLTLVAFGTSAQVIIDPDWKETEVPLPPAFNKDRLIPLDMPRYVSLQFGVDPTTLVLTPDGIARYIVVAINASGSLSAMYEGIRCSTGEVKTYARYASNGQWFSIKNPPWQGLNDNLPSKHARVLATQGVCDNGSTTGSSVADMVRALKK